MIVIKFCIRQFMNSSLSYSVNREARMLAKMIESVHGKKKEHSVKFTFPKQGNLLDSIPVRKQSRRMAILNKTFMQHVTAIMSTGNMSSRISDLGIRITQVQVDKLFQTLSVYWIGLKNVTSDENIAEVLEKATPEIQHDLNSLRITGKSLKIKFVKDVSLEQQMEVERTLESLNLLQKLETADDEKITESFANLPEMRQDIFGLNHSKIMKNILTQIRKKKLTTSESPSEENRVIKEGKNKPIPIIPFDKNLFNKFYKERHKMLKKFEIEQKRRAVEGSFNSDDEIDEDYYSDSDREFSEDDFEIDEYYSEEDTEDDEI